MTEIKVILDAGPLANLDALSSDERALMFDQLAADHPDISKNAIDDFIAMTNEAIENGLRMARPDLKELLLRKIINLAQGHGSNFNTLVIPIISRFDVAFRKGGAIPPMRRRPMAAEQKREEIPGAIKIRFDTQIFAVTTAGLDYIVPANEELDVMGFIVNLICAHPKTLGKNDSIVPLTALVVDQPAVGDRIVPGTFTYPMASRACDAYFVHPNYDIDIAGTTYSDATRFMFEDMNEAQLMRTLNAVFDYLASAETYHRGVVAAQFVHAQLDRAIRAESTDKSKELSPLADALVVDSIWPENIPAGVEGPRAPILDVLETVHNGRFNATFSLSVQADVDMRGFSRIYQKSILNGRDDPEVTADINLHKERKARIAFQESIRARLLDERNKLNIYISIIEKKLGRATLAAVENQITLKPALTISAKNVLDLLKPAERKLIELEFDKREKYLAAVINNKCQHVRLYRQFRLARDDERAKRYYRDLHAFFKLGASNTHMITCNVCGFDILCPHMKDFTELDFAGKSQDEIKAKLTKYIDKSIVRDQYHCKICGEVISNLEAFSDATSVRDPLSMMNEELKTFMWGEIAILTKYLKFGSLVNVKQLITTARDTCYPFIFEIEKQLLKSKTNSADETKAKKRLYVTIYAFAYFVHLLMSNRSRTTEPEVSFRNFTPKTKTEIVDLIKHSLDIIMTSRNIVIREIPGMSGDIIKNTLIEAYKSMQNVGRQVIVHSGETEDLLTALVLDPVYKYYYMVNLVDEILGGKKPPGASKKYNLVDRIDTVMGESVAKLEKATNLFEHARVPRFDKWRMSNFDSLSKTPVGKILDKTRFIWQEAYPGYIARSFELFERKNALRLYAEPVYVDVTAGRNTGTADPTMEVKFRPPHEEYRKQYLGFEALETRILQCRALASAQTYRFSPSDRSRRWTNPKVKLGRIFDEDGNPHVFDLYTIAEMRDGKQERIDYTAKDFARRAELGQDMGKIIGRKCSICGVPWALAGKLSEDKIRLALSSKHAVSNFFRFYENRCPKGGLHDFGDSSICAKCNMDQAFTLATTPAALKYYTEYATVYAAERKEFAPTIQALAALNTAETAITPPVDTSYEAEYVKWSANFNIILDLSNKLKLNHRLLSAMGAVEKVEYAEVQSGAYIPPELDARNSTRIFVVDSYIKTLITEYNQLRFFHRLVKPPMSMSMLIDNSGINKHKIAELSNKLPDIFNDYNNKFVYVQRVKKPREIIDFCIQSFCEMCLRIWGDPDKETEKLRHDFTEYIVKKIIRAEELVSKPGHFNWSLLYGDKDSKEKDPYDMNFNKDTEVEKDREGDEAETDDNFGDTGAPLEANDFDMEEDPDDEPDADKNEWRVGENLGLD